MQPNVEYNYYTRFQKPSAIMHARKGESIWIATKIRPYRSRKI